MVRSANGSWWRLDRLGAATVLEILANMHAQSGDPRYRASPWLRRRAALGMSLLTPEI